MLTIISLPAENRPASVNHGRVALVSYAFLCTRRLSSPLAHQPRARPRAWAALRSSATARINVAVQALTGANRSGSRPPMLLATSQMTNQIRVNSSPHSQSSGRRRSATPVSLRSWRRFHADASVHHGHPLRNDDQWVAIRLGELGVGLDHRADPQQYVGDRVGVAGRGTSVAVQERKGPQRVDHLLGVRVGDRRDPHRHVAEQLGGGAARAAGDDRPK